MAGACRVLQWSELHSTFDLLSLDVHADKTRSPLNSFKLNQPKVLSRAIYEAFRSMPSGKI